MKTILDHVARRAELYAESELFQMMRNQSLSLERRLAYVPGATHFVMTFADIYANVLRDEELDDPDQRLVNAHALEDGGHWKWFLADLPKLGADPVVRFSEALRMIWSDSTLKTRQLSYLLCKLGLGASSLQKLVLVFCIEAAGKVGLENISFVTNQLAPDVGRKLLYFGAKHFSTESEHTLESDAVHRELLEINLDAKSHEHFAEIIDEVFSHFEASAQELARYLSPTPGDHPNADYRITSQSLQAAVPSMKRREV